MVVKLSNTDLTVSTMFQFELLRSVIATFEAELTVIESFLASFFDFVNQEAQVGDGRVFELHHQKGKVYRDTNDYHEKSTDDIKRKNCLVVYFSQGVVTDRFPKFDLAAQVNAPQKYIDNEEMDEVFACSS